MGRNAIIFTANTIHVAQASLMIDSLFDPNKGNFKGDLWVISTHLSKRCKDYLDSKGIGFLINPLVGLKTWKHKERVAKAQPEFVKGELDLKKAFELYRNKRMSKLIISDWVSKFGESYDQIALCDNDLYFQRDINSLFQKASIDKEVVWYWHEENRILPETGLWAKNLHYTRLHDVHGLDFGQHEINIGFIISTPKLIKTVFSRVRELFSSCHPELFELRKWHDQDLVRLIRAQSPHLFRLFEEGDVLHLCNGGEQVVEERFPEEFFHKKTNEKPYVVHFAGGAWKPFKSIAQPFKTANESVFFMEEHTEAYDKVRRRTEYDPFDQISGYYTERNRSTRFAARNRWQELKATSAKPSVLFFSWFNTGSHTPPIEMIRDFLEQDVFDMAVIDGNVSKIDYSGLSVEDYPDLLSNVTRTIRNKDIARAYGYNHDEVPEGAVSGAIAALMHEYRCSERAARAVCNIAYLYLRKTLSFYRPDLIVYWGAYLYSARILKEMCRAQGVRFISLELGVLPDTLGFDCLGHMGESWVARHSAEFNALPLSAGDREKATAYLARVRESRPSRNKKLEPSDTTQARINRVRSSSKKKVVYIGSNCAFSGNVPYNEKAIAYHSPFFRHNDDVVKHLSSAFADSADIEIIYKPHPIVVTRGLDLADEYPNVIVLQDVNLDECIGLADLVIVKVSQGSYEALLRDKPVLMVGINQINGSGAVYQLSARERLYEDVLTALDRGLLPEQKDRFEEHVARLLKYYLYNVTGAIGAQDQALMAQRMLRLISGNVEAPLEVESRALNAYISEKKEPDSGNPTFSVVMPVFNGEEYLADCIGSILNQSFSDLELICVNNGSTDGSQAIIDYFTRIDPRVKSVFQEEPNQRAARNRGVEQAKGRYIHFSDCDDLLVCDAYERLHERLDSTNADVLYFFFNEMHAAPTIANPRFHSFERYLPDSDLFRMNDIHRRLFAQQPFPWAKIFRADFFREKGLYFDLDCDNYDDNPQNLRTLLSSDCIYVYRKSLYKFRINPKSMTQSVNPRVFGMIDAIRIMNEILVRFDRYQEFQPWHVAYKIHLVNFAWSKLPEDLKSRFYTYIPSLFMPGDEEFFEREEIFSLFDYMTEGKIAFVRRALKNEGVFVPEPKTKSGLERGKRAKQANKSRFQQLEKRLIDRIERSLSSNPKLLDYGKQLYRAVNKVRYG